MYIRKTEHKRKITLASERPPQKHPQNEAKAGTGHCHCTTGHTLGWMIPLPENLRVHSTFDWCIHWWRNARLCAFIRRCITVLLGVLCNLTVGQSDQDSPHETETNFWVDVLAVSSNPDLVRNYGVLRIPGKIPFRRPACLQAVVVRSRERVTPEPF